MSEFLAAITNPEVASLRYALYAGLLGSVAFGVVGSYVVARRITYIAAAISHSILGGIGLSLYLRQGLGMTWCDPMYGAVAAALISALIVGFVSMWARQREDTVIGAVWAIGMAGGLLFLRKTPGYVDPMSYLFGDILFIAKQELWLLVALDALVVGLALLFFNKLLAVCFDEEFARLRGVRVEVYYILLLCLTALTVVLMVRIVGIVLVIALLTLPAAVAGQLTRRIQHMMILSVLLCAVFTSTGLALSYSPDLPPGPTIILIGGLAYLCVAGIRRLVRGRR